VPAAEGAILNLSELAFAYLLDVTVLREPTSALAAFGTGVVFVGSAFVAAAKRRETDETVLLDEQDAPAPSSAAMRMPTDTAEEAGTPAEREVELELEPVGVAVRGRRLSLIR
jgi:hypothetical protein